MDDDKLDKVIKALEQCREGKPSCDGCPYDIKSAKCLFLLHSDALELLKEQQKTGKWEEKVDYIGDTYYDCSACGESWTTIEGTPWQNGMNYCPNCGAKMELVK